MPAETTPPSVSPLVSVGIPTLRQPQRLERTLQYVCSQTYKNLEIVVSDNCTPGPEIESLMRRWLREDSRICFHAQPYRLSIFGNFQFVLAQARGEFFIWAADDDEWGPSFIERCLAHAGTSGSVMCSFHTHLRSTGELLYTPIPVLDPANGRLGNVQRFLEQLQPILFYGLHRRAEIGFVLEDDFFDFYDRYFVLRQLLGPGFRTFPDTLYRVGVDASAYAIMCADEHQRRLDYGSFLMRSMQLVMQASGLAVGERLQLLCQLWAGLQAQVRRYHDAVVSPSRRLLTDALRSLLCSRAIDVAAAELGTGAAAEGARSYAQSGEDVIADFVFCALRVDRPTYLDIGAHHPRYLSNTCRFYERGCRGVNVEPDPDLFRAFAQQRPNDVNLNAGIGADAGGTSLPFYVLSERTLNTFSRTEAERCVAGGSQRIEAVIEVPVYGINTICEQYFAGSGPDFLTVDVEGLDFEIVRSLDLDRFRPALICVETLTYSESREERKRPEIVEYLLGHGYFVYADTYINTLFVDRARWLASA